jgi:hypothetical protein
MSLEKFVKNVPREDNRLKNDTQNSANFESECRTKIKEEAYIFPG